MGGGKCELTWERSRNVQIMPVPQVIHMYKKVKLNLNCDVVFNIENSIEKCINRIQGWAFLKNVDSKDSVVYIHITLKRKIVKEIILPLKISERRDVAEAFNDSQYMNCGFSAYMPAEIIINQINMSKIELVVENGEKCGSVIIKQLLY